MRWRESTFSDGGGLFGKLEESVGVFAALNGRTGGFATEALPAPAPMTAAP